MSLPNGFWPVVQTFGVDQYRTFYNPYRESWQPYFANDDAHNSNWPVFIEAVAMPRSQVPRGMVEGVGDLLDIWPRAVVYYGGPIARYYAESYRRSFESWAHGMGWACDTDIIPVQPNTYGMRFPSNDFKWYVAYNEQRPQKRYRFVRPYGGSNFHWVDLSFDIWKYANFHRQYPNIA